MAAKDSKALSELSQLTECCICLMPFTDPRMLPCIHSACLKCFEDIQTKNKRKPGDVIPCPVCRKEFTVPPTGMSGLQKNFFIANLLEITQNNTKFNKEATSQRCKMCQIIDVQKDASEVRMKCLECRKTFCERCANVHKFNDLTQGHRIVEIKENLGEEEVLLVLPPPNCTNHPLQVLNYYCGDCKTVVCVSCFVEKHKSHNCKDVTTVDKDFRKDIEARSSNLLHYVVQMEAKRSKMESKKTNFLEQTSEIENAIRLKNQQLKTLVDQHTNRVLNDLFSIKQKLSKHLETEIDEIEFKMSLLQSFEKYCSEMKSKGSPTDVCSCVDRLVRRTDELKKENDEYLDRPDSVVEVKFKAADQHALIEGSSNVIGQIQESMRKLKSSAIIIGRYEDNLGFKDVTKVNLHQPEDVSKLQQMPTAMQFGIASTVYRNSIYITGIGKNKDENWKFNGTSDIWEKCASMVKGRRKHSMAFVDQFLFICGGYVHSDGSVLDDVEAYDAINDRCSAVGKLLHCVQGASNCVPFKSSLYIFGGKNANNKVMSHVQVYETKSNTCTLLSHPMPVASNHMRAALYGKTFVLLDRNRCFLYDLDKGVWQVRRQFGTEVVHFGMTIENGQIFVFGGGVCTTDAGGKSKWVCRDDVRCIPVKNIMEDIAIEWRHHAKLSRSSLVFSCEKIEIEV